MTHSRLVVVAQVYHQVAGRPASSCEPVRFTRHLESDEQPYGPRSVTAGPDWQPLNTGWLGGDVGLLLLANEEGRNPQVIPTREEADALAARVLEVAVTFQGIEPIPFALVRPGEALPLPVADVRCLRVRCRSGTCRYTVTAYPA